MGYAMISCAWDSPPASNAPSPSVLRSLEEEGSPAVPPSPREPESRVNKRPPVLSISRDFPGFLIVLILKTSGMG